jgi:AcrR family transcriptional regulator
MKERILEKAIQLSRFRGLGSLTLDKLSQELGMSKKTFYKFYSDKNSLVLDSVYVVLEYISDKIEKEMTSDANPIYKLCSIYGHCAHVSICFPPHYMAEIKKKYSPVYEVIMDYRETYVKPRVFKLLKEAEQSGYFSQGTNIQLILELQMFNIEMVPNLFKDSFPEFLNHLLINNMKGILNAGYIGMMSDYSFPSEVLADRNKLVFQRLTA